MIGVDEGWLGVDMRGGEVLNTVLLVYTADILRCCSCTFVAWPFVICVDNGSGGGRRRREDGDGRNSDGCVIARLLFCFSSIRLLCVIAVMRY